jgi:hypothetical protein
VVGAAASQNRKPYATGLIEERAYSGAPRNNAVMPMRAEQDVLGFVDLVLGDLARRDGMFVGRRADEGDAENVVIQTGEDGRYRLSLRDDSAWARMRFMAAAQAHVGAVLRRPVPSCPMHGHALRPAEQEGRLCWQCPRYSWLCEVGEYEEQAWPLDLGDGMGAALCARLAGRNVDGWARLSVGRRDGEWVAVVGLREPDPELESAISVAASPVAVEFDIRDWPVPRRV